MMESISDLPPLFLLVFGAAVIIMVLVLFAKAVKVTLKLAVIGIMLLLIAYFLREAGLLPF